MGEEQDSWFKQAFGVDLGQAAQAVEAQVVAAVGEAGTQVSQLVQKAEAVVEPVIDSVLQGVSSVVKTVGEAVAGAVSGAVPGPGASAAAGSSSGGFPLRGSVGRGGANAAADVSAVQTALGIAADGRCGAQTIGAIEAFQRRMGQARADGRVDAGGGTERALVSGDAAATLSPAGPAREPGFVEAAVEGLKDLGSEILQGIEGVVATPGALIDQLTELADPPDKPPDAGAAAPDPTFVDVDRPFRVLADNPIEFIDKANQFLGQGAAGHMTTDTLTVAQAEQDSKGRVVKSNMVVKTTTTRPHWAGGRTIGDEKAVIEQAEELIRAHEERHRQIMKDGMSSAAAEMRGKPGSQADTILTKWIAKVDKDQNALDAREGQIVVIQGGGRITGVRLAPL